MILGEGLHVHMGGEGDESVLWFHGYTLDSSVFEPVWRLLPGRRHLGLDLPGHGRSRTLRSNESLVELAGEIAAAAQQHGIRHLVGLSFGTVVALQVALMRPDAFSTLVLAAPGLTGGPEEPEIQQRYLELGLLYRRLGPGPHMTRLWMSCPPDIFRFVLGNPSLTERLQRVIDRHRWSELANMGMLGLTRPAQTAGSLAAVRARTLVLVGEHEIPAHRECAAILGESIPGCDIALLPDGGHLAMLEQPESAAQAIEEHLRGGLSR